MSGLLPRKPPVERPDSDARVIGIEDDDAGDVLSVLASDVARAVLAELYRGPAPQSELADAVGTSIQNAGHHLGRLVDVGLVEVVDQWYSEKGTEMDVFAPDREPVVLVSGCRNASDGAPGAADSARDASYGTRDASSFDRSYR